MRKKPTDFRIGSNGKKFKLLITSSETEEGIEAASNEMQIDFVNKLSPEAYKGVNPRRARIDYSKLKNANIQNDVNYHEFAHAVQDLYMKEAEALGDNTILNKCLAKHFGEVFADIYGVLKSPASHSRVKSDLRNIGLTHVGPAIYKSEEDITKAYGSAIHDTSNARKSAIKFVEAVNHGRWDEVRKIIKTACNEFYGDVDGGAVANFYVREFQENGMDIGDRHLLKISGWMANSYADKPEIFLSKLAYVEMGSISAVDEAMKKANGHGLSDEQKGVLEKSVAKSNAMLGVGQKGPQPCTKNSLKGFTP